MLRIGVKILGYKTPQRYAVRRAVLAAWNELLREHPGLELDILELKELLEIQRYTQVFVYPSLVVNEQLVCVGRFPKKEEIISWLCQALDGPPAASEK
ncbi:MAG: thioredoxin family protein [Chloroflexi bacterium]|nr:thioredoxin family protein [Chloroflexota bacterium]